MTAILYQHWPYHKSFPIAILAAATVLVTVVVGILKLRLRRSATKPKTAAKALFPKNRVFLIEKASDGGCARPCATGPLFHFDSGEQHESLDGAEGFKPRGMMPGQDKVALFAPEWEYAYEQQGAPRQDMFLPPPDPSHWKHALSYDQQHLQAQPPMHHMDPGYYTQSGDHAGSYGLFSGEDDSDSGASLPSHNVESLELGDPLSVSGLSIQRGVNESIPQLDPFAPPIGGNALGNGTTADLNLLPTHPEMDDGLMMQFNKALDPLDPNFELLPRPRSLLSEGLRGFALPEHQMPNKHAFGIDSNSYAFNPSLRLPLSKPYALEEHRGAHHIDTRGLEREDNNGESGALNYNHFSSSDSEHFSPVHAASLSEGHTQDFISVSAASNGRRKAPFNAAVKKERVAPRKRHFQFPEGIDADFAMGLPSFVAESLPGSVTPSLGPIGEFDAPSSVNSGVSVGLSPNSPKSPKDVEFSGDDGSPRYRCPHCDTTFRIRGYLTRHIKKHADVMMYNCPFYNAEDEHRCHATGGFSRRDTYKTHLKARHFLYPRGTGRKDRYRMPGTCSGCNQKFNNNEEWIETHIQPGLCSGRTNFEGSDTETREVRTVSPSSSPSSEGEIEARAEQKFPNDITSVDGFQRQSMLLTHVQ